MDKFAKEKLKYAAVIFLIISWQCANQLPPGGGGIDLVPPKIEKAYPSNGTTNYKENYFELDFSKYVQKRSVQDAIFISPAIDGDLNFDWSGTSVRVYFPSKLKENTTYVITIGTDLVDYNNGNHMAQAYNLAFSTGDKIYNGEIGGKVFSDNPQGVLLYAYVVGDSAINPMLKKPDFVSEAGIDGSFKLLGLAPGSYRVFAVVDKSRTLLYQPDQDEIGIPSNDVRLSETDTLFKGLDFFLSNQDTVKPRLQSATMTDTNHLFVSFSKDIDTSIIHSNNFFIYDSTAEKKYDVLYAYKGNKKPNEIILVQTNKFPIKDEVYLFARKVADKLGNIFYGDYSSITLGEKADTMKTGIFNANPPAGSNQADYENQRFSFYLTDAVDSNLAKTGIAFADTSGKYIPFAVHFYDDASLYVYPLQNLETRSDYIIKLNLNKFRNAAGLYYDSTYAYKFSTINGLDFTGASGKLISDTLENPVLVLQGIDKDKLIYYTRPGTNNTFKFDRVTGGKYLLWYFSDTDSSGTYTYGKVLPFKASEKFSFYPDTLNLRPRWVVTGINFLTK